MKFSIITVNLNDAQGLRKTIRSVVEQSFSDYEFIVIDGGSTDGSVEALEEYRDHITYWVSEKDSGIYNGMNKGIGAAKGEYLCFLNSGDVFTDADVLGKVAPCLGKDVVVGRINFTDSNGVFHKDFQRRIRRMTPQNFRASGIPHQASFIRRSLFEKYGLYDESYRISADWKFFLLSLAIGKSSFRYIPVTIADFDGSGISSRNNRLMMDEIARAYRELVQGSDRPTMKKRVTKFLSEIKNFGPAFVFRLHVMTRIHKGNRYRQNLIMSYLSKKYSGLVQPSGSDDFMPLGENFPVWVCWLQVESQMPPVVRKCYSEMKKYWGEERVKLITESNYQDYVAVPLRNRDLFEKRRMPAAHFSDIIRFGILANHGGLWLDATLLMTSPLNISDMPFFTIKGTPMDEAYVSDYQWAGYCMGGAAHSPLFTNLTNLLNAYWHDHDRLIDYFLMDYLIRIIYTSCTGAKHLIDNVPSNNPDVAFLQQHFEDKFCEEDFIRVCKTTDLHKLSWKGSPRELTPEGELTYYGYILSK